jgi:hypothetical protein
LGLASIRIPAVAVTTTAQFLLNGVLDCTVRYDVEEGGDRVAGVQADLRREMARGVVDGVVAIWLFGKFTLLASAPCAKVEAFIKPLR